MRQGGQQEYELLYREQVSGRSLRFTVMAADAREADARARRVMVRKHRGRSFRRVGDAVAVPHAAAG